MPTTGAKMLLNEFFGRPVKLGKSQDKDNNKDQGKNDELFWFMLDHDRLHKDHFFPLAQRIKKDIKANRLNKDECMSTLKPMVEKGCMEFYAHHKMTGRPGKLFPKEMRDDLCERLFDHYVDGIKKDHYKLGI
jgi:hypothetical protein